MTDYYNSRWRCRKQGRGRDGGYPPPPAQTRTRGTTASGSHLGSMAQREPLRFSPAHTAARAPVYPGTESRTGLLQSVPLGQRPSLHALRQRSYALVRTFRGYYAATRLLDHVHPGLICLRLSPDGPLSSADVTEVSRFSRMKFPGVPGVFDYAGLMISSRLRIPRCCLPASPNWVGALNCVFAAPYPAHQCRCLRFAPTSRWICARLEVRMVHYSFPVRLFHSLLHAGLSRRSGCPQFFLCNLCDASDLPSLQCVHASGCLVPCRAQTTFSEISWNVLSFSIVFR